jgi:hypothetical protein
MSGRLTGGGVWWFEVVGEVRSDVAQGRGAVRAKTKHRASGAQFWLT